MAVRLNLCLPVPDPWFSFAREVSRELTPLGNVIDLAIRIPHVTVFMASFPDDAVEAVIDASRRALAPLGAFEAPVGGFALQGGYVFLEVELVPELGHLHRSALTTLAPLRRGVCVEDERLRVAARSPELLPLYDRYGSSRVVDHYRPHLTLGRLPDGLALPDVRAAMPARSITLRTLAVGLGGEHGVVEQLLHEIPLAP